MSNSPYTDNAFLALTAEAQADILRALEPAAGGAPAPAPALSILGVALPAGAPGDELEPTGTPPGSPRVGPMWRTGSCGESGPWIGLSYGWGCELSRRWARWPDVDPFHLKQQMFADLATEPDLLRDFTEDEVIRGMGAYSWSAERTRTHLAELRAERAAAAGGAPAARVCPTAQARGEARCPSYVICFTCMSREELARAEASGWR